MKPKTNPKREKIIEAAIQVFSSKGYHTARMEEIAQAAGIGKGTIYEYFNSKIQLFQEMLENSLECYYLSFTDQHFQKLSTRERIHLLLESHIRFCVGNQDLTRIIFSDQDLFLGELKEWSENWRRDKEKRMRALVEEGISRGEIKPLSAQLLSTIMLGIMGSIWIPLALGEWEADAGRLADEVTQIIMQGIEL